MSILFNSLVSNQAEKYKNILVNKLFGRCSTLNVCLSRQQQQANEENNVQSCSNFPSYQFSTIKYFTNITNTKPRQLRQEKGEEEEEEKGRKEKETVISLPIISNEIKNCHNTSQSSRISAMNRLFRDSI